MTPPRVHLPAGVQALLPVLESAEGILERWGIPTAAVPTHDLPLYHLLAAVEDARARRAAEGPHAEIEALEALAFKLVSPAAEATEASSPSLAHDEARDVVFWLRDHLDASAHNAENSALGAGAPGLVKYLPAFGLLLGDTEDVDIQADKRRSGFWLGYADKRNTDIFRALTVHAFARMDLGKAPTAEDYRRAFENRSAVKERGTLGPDSAWLASSPPNGSPRYLNDRVFAARAVAGPDPRSIRRLADADLPAPYPQDRLADALRAVGVEPPAGVTLAGLAADGRLFCIDHRNLALTAQDGLQAVVQAFALFAVLPAPSPRALLPLGIHDGHTWLLPAPEGTPSRDAWLTGRAAFGAAELAHHELYTHLGQVHFVLLAMVRALRLARDTFGPGAVGRRTADLLGLLLEPHVRFVAFNMGVGAATLVNPGGLIDRILAADETSGRKLVRRAVLEWDATRLSPAEEAAARGCDDVQTLPYYPYRDRAAALWDACFDFVGDVLGAGDPADRSAFLAAYKTQLAGALSGVVRDLERTFHLDEAPIAPGTWKLDAVDLKTLVTGLISLSSFVHAAVNYPQIEHMMLASWMPASPRIGSREWMPGADRGALQMEALFLLGCRRYERLPDASYDGIAPAHVEAFRTALQALQTRFEAEESQNANNHGTDTIPYPYLHPKVVPAAANV